MTRRPYLLSECTWAEIKDRHIELAVLPWGACEAHNYHLPYATDNIQADFVAAAAAKYAWDAGTKVIVLPCIPLSSCALPV